MLIATLSLGIFACDDSSDSSSESVLENSSVEESSVDESIYADPDDGGYAWTEWELVKEPTCSEAGEKIRARVDDDTIMQTGLIRPRGHAYAQDAEEKRLAGEMGVCIRCGQTATIPALSAKQEFPEVDAKGKGDGAYNRLELSEGCHTVEIPATGELWLSYPVSKAGQYVLYSVGGKAGVTAERFNAEAHFVNENGGFAAAEKDGNFYSYVNCGEQYFSTGWRATFRLKGTADTLVKICFTRVDDPAWEPSYVHLDVTPTEINGKKAPEPAKDAMLYDVPYTSDYFYNEADGYYYLGTKDAPKQLIYVAINTAAKRLLGEYSFTTVTENIGSALTLQKGINADGDFVMLHYIPFIMNLADDNAALGTRPGVQTGEASEAPEVDLNKNCYQNYCNSDGMYPATKELVEFLKLYVEKNSPLDDKITDEDWAQKKDWLWLSACYYYDVIPVGTETNPIEITQTGEYKVSVPARDFVWYKLTGSGNYTITCNTPNANIQIGNQTPSASFTIPVQGPVVFRVFTLSMEELEITFTIQKVD